MSRANWIQAFLSSFIKNFIQEICNFTIIVVSKMQLTAAQKMARKKCGFVCVCAGRNRCAAGKSVSRSGWAARGHCQGLAPLGPVTGLSLPQWTISQTTVSVHNAAEWQLQTYYTISIFWKYHLNNNSNSYVLLTVK